jgi:predicted acyltransferase (DUF342 family)
MIEFFAPVVLFAVLLGWYSLPLLPTLVEIRRRAEAGPLRVDRENDGEVRHFARRFKAYLESHFKQPSLSELIARSVSQEGRFNDGTPYRIVGRDVSVAADKAAKSVNGIVLCCEPAELPERLEFVDGIYAANDIDCGKETIIRSLYAERNARLQDGVVVLRWIHVQNELAVENNAVLYGRASAEALIRIGAGVEFERLHARRILFKEARMTAPGNAASSVTLTPRDVVARRRVGRCYFLDEDLNVAAQTVVRGDFVVQGAVRIGRNARVEGSIKSRDDMFIEAGAQVQGSVISGRDLEIGPDCKLRGPVVSSRRLTVRSGCQIGDETYPTSAIAPSILIEAGVVVFGTVWASSHGRVA